MALNIEKTQSVTDALNSRITVRHFLNKPVPDDVLRRLFTTALRSPSGGNLQPWKVHVLRGAALKALTEDGVKRAQSGVQETPTYAAYPSPLWEPQRSWRYKLGEDMYGCLGIEKDNKLGRLMWLMQNIKFFEAPVGVIITGHKKLEMPQHLDIGIYLQSVMLLAREEGLHTAPQGWWRHWPDLLSDHLTIDEDEEVLVGCSLGYGDPDHKVNGLYADRATLDDVTKFYD